MQTLQDFNLDLTSYVYTTHIINAFFVKTNDVSVVYMIQEITSILSDVILHNNFFHHSTLWIPHSPPYFTQIFLPRYYISLFTN